MWHCRYLCKRTKVRVFRSLVLLVLLYGYETWILSRNLRRRLNFFITRSLRRILCYCWSDFVSNERLLRETQRRYVTCIVCERQLRLYVHVAHFVDDDPAHQIFSAREPREWRRPMDQTTCLMVAAGCSASQGDGDRPGICLGDGQTEAPGGKWTQRRAALAHAPITDLTFG